MTTTIPHCVEHKGQFLGVKLPKWLRAFDCRCPESGAFYKAPHGETLYGCERAQFALGLKQGWSGDATTPVSCQAYRDFRDTNPEELARVAVDMIREAKRLRREYQAALRNPAPANEGGSGHYAPVAISLANYGWSVIADRRAYAVQRFRTL